MKRLPDQFQLDDKNVIVTGAASGIGRQCAIEFSRRGANLILVDMDGDKLEGTLQLLDPGFHNTLQMDLRQFVEFSRQFAPVLEKYKMIHGFVHSAGIQMTSPFKSMKLEATRMMFDINLFAALELTKISTNAKHIPDSGSSIVFIAAVAGIRGRAAITGYSASKGAIIAAMRSLAMELARKRVRVNCISPGLIQTELVSELFTQLTDEQKSERLSQYPLGPGYVEDIANACVFLLSEASRWITGTNLIVDGGYSAH